MSRLMHYLILARQEACSMLIFLIKLYRNKLIFSDKTKSLSSHQLICTELDVDLYDIQNKPLLTKGIISLPIIYGNHVLHQEFIVTNGISESCVLGQDAAIKHEFIFDGGKRLYFCHVINQWIYWLLITRHMYRKKFSKH